VTFARAERIHWANALSYYVLGRELLRDGALAARRWAATLSYELRQPTLSLDLDPRLRCRIGWDVVLRDVG